MFEQWCAVLDKYIHTSIEHMVYTARAMQIVDSRTVMHRTEFRIRSTWTKAGLLSSLTVRWRIWAIKTGLVNLIRQEHAIPHSGRPVIISISMTLFRIDGPLIRLWKTISERDKAIHGWINKLLQYNDNFIFKRN